MSEINWALTVPQPAAWAIAHGHQDVYDRSYSTERRGLLAICAGESTDEALLRRTAELTGLPQEEVVAACTGRNEIVAVARLVDVCDGRSCTCGPWAGRRFVHWRLADAVLLPDPVPAPRTLGIWRMQPVLAGEVEEQWRAAAAARRPRATGGRRDSAALRDELLPLPSSAEGYRRVLLLGTTGAGKTTAVRQLLGTDPATERFPSTSAAKTTVADTEIIMSGGGRYSAAVTFAGRDEIAGHLRDNVWETAKAVLEERPPDVVQDKLLDHVSQRFRFSHVLGRAAPPRPAAGPDDDLDDFEETDDDEAPAVRAADPATTELVRSAVQAVRAVVAGERAGLSVRRAPGDDDRTDEEIIEDELENRVRRSAVCERIVETLLAEIAARFDLLEAGDLHRDGDGWPVSWTWDSGDRAEFLRVVTRFSSNRTALFGRLLTPLVDGIRVRGPFRPLWAEREARLVLIDGEGLGHIPGSVAAVSTRLRRRLDEVDAIVLVDNAQQPMQAAPVAVMRTAAATGNGEKLHFLFTHFDLVTGDNLHTVGDRKRHVLASAENVLNEIREELGIAERVLRRRLDEARHFVGGIERALAPDRPDPRPKAAARTMRELNALLDALAADPVPVETGPSRPVYRTADLTEAVAEAARGFHGQWRATLGLAHDPRWPKRHWASVKALTRRLAEGHTDEYQDLRPAASLRTMLEDAVYRMLQRPVRWTGPEPDVEDQEVVVGDVASALTRRLIGLVDRLVTEEPRPVWKRAYEQHGKGSTIRRAHIVIDGIYAEAVPFPTNKAAYENRFSDAVAAAFKEAAAELDLALE